MAPQIGQFANNKRSSDPNGKQRKILISSTYSYTSACFGSNLNFKSNE